ncbi:MAG: T9SS type A sorting domain-containing protein [Saprospiraceae bacterium]|nr:T9SS type A sorting domain-containing protein [Saprospiraceae bacterium]
MKRPLEKHFDYENVRNGFRIVKAGLTLFVLFLAFNLSFGQTFSRIECQCLNNSTTDDNGQFGETITINSNSSETWFVVTSSGLYTTTSPPPPAAPVEIPPGTGIPEGLPGQYILDAKRVNNTNWTLEVSNGAITIPISSAHLCQYPTNEIIGDFGTCIETIETYELALPASQVGVITWTVSAGGNIVGGQGSRRIFVDWSDVVGDYDVSFTGTAGAYDGQANDFCDFSGSESVAVMDEEAFALACNNQVNISLNGNCDLDITPDMILEDMEFSNDSYDLLIKDIAADTIVTGPTLGMEYINTTLEVSVVHECSGNSCWGYILLEDKSIPPLICENDTIDCNEFMTPDITGFPVPDDVTITPLGDDKYLLENFDKCSDAIIFYEDTPVTMNLCTSPYSSIIERNWVVEDNSGNTASCTELIYVNKATLMDITFPPSYDDVLGPNPSLEACDNFPKLANGYPDPSFTGMPEGIFCLNVKVDYEDTELPKCGDESYKLRRRWVIQDLCDGTFLPPYTQNITVVDHTAPVITAPKDFTVGATETSCSSIIEVPQPMISDCSGTSYTISYNPVESGVDPFFQPSNDGIVEHSNGSFLITQVPEGVKEIWILYYAIDDCDNMSTDFTKVTIEDDIQPIPVCDLHTFVGLNENGIGYASIESFDDGSWDNCEIDYMEVRRMGNFACGESVNWGEKVKFCCADVGNVVMVQLRVVDKSGNSNFCMVEAEVQDNHDPEFTFCPADITIDCDDDTVNLDQYGTAQAIDNCNVTVTSTSQRNINACGVGVITRTFRAEDDQGNFVTCQQRIRVQSLDPFYINPNNPNDPTDDVIWPGNHTVQNGCAYSGVPPDDLPAGKQRPVILREACSQISFTYDDVIFQYTEEACTKILRTWKVIDDCVFVPISNAGLWTYTQVIKVENSTEPSFIVGCQVSDYTVTQLSNCSARIEATAQAVDDCTPTDELTFSYKFDEDNNGSIDFSGNGSSISRVVEFGSHRVIWEVEDECGNIETCATVINVDDDKAPTPYCLSEIVTVVMETSGSVTIWASDFDNGSFDNCADADELIASFSPNTNNTSATFTCDDLDGEATSFDLEIYITDPAGNQDFCTTSLIVQDNQNHCNNNVDDGSNDDEERVALGGHIFNDENENLVGVNVTLNSTLPEFPKLTSTDEDGGYSFHDLLMEENYSIAPDLDASYHEGVSTLDLVLIQQHLLGLKPFDNPYKVIAADINNSESVTAADLLQLRKLILGIYSELPSNSSWRFVDAAYEFPEPNNPFPFDEKLDMDTMMEDYMDADFVAVKVGDVNNTASTNLMGETISSARSVEMVNIEDQYLNEGIHDVMISLNEDAELYGMQFALNINDNLVSDVEVSSEVFNVSEGNYTRNTKLYVSVHQANSVYADENVLTLTLTVKKAGFVSDMLGMASDDFSNEIYTASNNKIQTSTIGLDILNRTEDEVHAFELLQNVPNPFTTTTEIGFVLPSKEQVSLRVMDVTGKVLIRKTGQYQKGYNSITLDVSEINSSGILYYQLDTERNSATKKMMIIK